MEVPNLLEAISTNNLTLTTLQFYKRRLPVTDWFELFRALKDNNVVRHLNLSGCNVRGIGLFHLYLTLKNNTTVRCLTLSDIDMRCVEIIELSAFLRDNISVQQLDLSYNRLSRKGDSLIGLFFALQMNTTLRCLQLCGNNIACAGAIELSRVLQFNTSLTSLSLSDNQLACAGAIELSNALKRNTTLQRLNLSLNQIGNDGAIALAAWLTENSTLVALYLFHNIIGAVGAEAIAQSLTTNNNVEVFHFQGNNIENIGFSAFESALEHNKNLRTLHLLTGLKYEEFEFQFAIYSRIKKLLRRNNILQQETVWHPLLHTSFNHRMHDMLITFLLCNDVGGLLPRLPIYLWKLIFGFFLKKSFFIV